jgi:hypothetical protein
MSGIAANTLGVMRELDPRIHDQPARKKSGKVGIPGQPSWIAGSSPAMMALYADPHR